MSRTRRIAGPGAVVAVALALTFAAGPAEAPSAAPAVASLLPPGTVVEEVRVAGGGLVRAPAVTVVGGVVLVSGETGARELRGLEPSGPVRSRRMWLGTDSRGRDLAGRLAAGARTSLAVAAIGAAIAVALGALLGFASARAGRRIAPAFRLAVDATIAIPRMLSLLILGAALGGSLVGVGMAIGLISWMGVARVVDAECRALAGRGFVEAARAVGVGRVRIAARHLLPHLAPILLTALPVAATDSVLLEATLSFLGIGAGPGADSWGAMVADGRRAMPAGWWIAAFPGLLVAGTALTFHALARAVRVDPASSSDL